MKISDFPIPDKPDYDIDFPDDLTALQTRDLGKLLTHLAGWKGFSATVLGKLEHDVVLMKEDFKLAMGRERAIKKKTRDELVASSSDLEEMENRLTNYQAKLAHLERLHSMYSDWFTAVSREISRRTIEMQEFGREERLR